MQNLRDVDQALLATTVGLGILAATLNASVTWTPSGTLNPDQAVTAGRVLKQLQEECDVEGCDEHEVEEALGTLRAAGIKGEVNAGPTGAHTL